MYEQKKLKLTEIAVTDVRPVWNEGVDASAMYPHECYMRAYRYATHVARMAETGIYLVHGTCSLFFGGHAWVELPEDGLVFDGVFQQFYPIEKWVERVHARPWYRYTPDAAALIYANVAPDSDGTYFFEWGLQLNLPLVEPPSPIVIDSEIAEELLGAASGLYADSVFLTGQGASDA